MSLLSEGGRDRLLERSSKVFYPAGSVPYFAGGPPLIGIVEVGMIRAFSGLPDGRQASVAYRHAGELFGGILALDTTVPIFSIQAVVDTHLIRLDADVVQELLDTDCVVARAMATDFARRLTNMHRLLLVRTLGQVRDRLAYDLLERACRSQVKGGALRVRATHEELAQSIGSAREVVSRAVADLRRSGVLARSEGQLMVLEPLRLGEIVRVFVGAD